MTTLEVLDKNIHKNTRIITGRGAEFGENIHLVPVIAQELHKLVLEYPICLIKDNNTGQFGLNALLGFEVGENLFLQGNEWQANYLPLHILRQPFMVGVNAKQGEQPTPDNTVITINTANARVQEDTGEMIFDEKGNITPYMQQMNNLLSTLVNGIINTESFINTLSEHNLIEPIQLTVNLIGSKEKRFDGIYTINEETLKQLSSEALKELNSKGYLQACYLLLASIGHVQKLITLKRQRVSVEVND
ncbi:SapC family protein [Colwellia echini]|uniref:SapC family protein n=1 Tax=Colwellia echini TaxID=1982103 RepID=A0ABY3N150_9GAMM|nr:SapC family protein [Colwellia echini]TYK67219.1 SapC family protein [Colwellia echini]